MVRGINGQMEDFIMPAVKACEDRIADECHKNICPEDSMRDCKARGTEPWVKP